jgi:elongation factor 1-gamma
MVNGTLYAAPNSFRTHKILIAAKYGDSGLKVEYPPHGLDSNKFPFGKLPTFETSDGKTLHDTHAVCLLVGGKSLTTGSNGQQAAEILQWLDLADNEFLPQVLGWVLPSLSALQYNKNNVEDAKKELLRLMHILDNYLLPRTFLVGERISLADVVLACNLLLAYQHVLEPENRAPFVNVNRWFQTCVHQPNFKSVLGEAQLCTKGAQFDANKFKEFQEKSCASASTAAAKPKEEKGKKDKKDKGGEGHKEEKKKEGGKKEEKKKDHHENGPAPAAAPEVDDEGPDATDEAMAAEPKQKDPFAAMPKGTFNMDEFKRVYSNEDTLTKALPYFWDNFDASANSIWYCDYKFPKELTLVFMSCNLIAGMYQRLDKLRKNAFGSMCLFGNDNNSTISGVWIWRGQDLVFPLSDDWTIDFESYNWRKLDPQSEETKTMIKEYFIWEGNFDGKKFNQGKIFK